jgi:predicted nucleic acid-binding protein
MARGTPGAAIQKVVFDTDVLIWYLRGNARALRFVAAIPYANRCVSSLTYMELLQGCRNRDEVRQVHAFISHNVPILLHPDESISRAAIDLIEEHALSRGLRVVDALIAATVLQARSSLATANRRHYRFISRLRMVPFRP